MKEEIGRLIEDIRQEQNQRRVMELQLLQEQINPHFLYNTLDTIVWPVSYTHLDVYKRQPIRYLT